MFRSHDCKTLYPKTKNGERNLALMEIFVTLCFLWVPLLFSFSERNYFFLELSWDSEEIAGFFFSSLEVDEKHNSASDCVRVLNVGPLCTVDDDFCCPCDGNSIFTVTVSYCSSDVKEQIYLHHTLPSRVMMVIIVYIFPSSAEGWTDNQKGQQLQPLGSSGVR